MKRRVLGVLSVLVLVLVLLVSTLLLSSTARELTNELQLSRVSSLNRIAQVAYDAETSGDTAVLQRDMDTYSELYGEGLVVQMQDTTLTSGGLDPGQADVRSALEQASLNLSDTELDVLMPFGSGTEVISRSFGSPSQVLGEVVLQVNLDAAREKLRHQWLITGAATAVLATLLLMGAGRFTDWVLRPVRRLNSAARELQGTGRVPRLDEAGPPELRELSRSFTDMATSLSELIDSQRQLIADTSHHLRNPVGALRLRLDLLLSELQEERAKEAGAGVLAELDRVEEILESVLRLAVSEHRLIEGAALTTTGPSAMSSTAVNPFILLQEEVDRAQPAALEAGVSITLVSPQKPELEILCNRIELAQMVGELLHNALKYAPGAPIVASVHQEGRFTFITIADTGPGLDPKQLDEVTTRFWRSPEHSGIRGTGMGMTIVNNLATANNGRLVLQPNVPNGLCAQIGFETLRADPGQEYTP